MNSLPEQTMIASASQKEGEKEREGERASEVKRVPEQGSPKGGSNVSTCLSATLDNQHSKQMKTHAYTDRAEWEKGEQRENGETEERWRFVLYLALAKVNWFSTSTPSLSFFWSGWRVRLCLGLSARLLVAALPVSLLPQLCHVLALWTAVNTHTYGTHTHTYAGSCCHHSFSHFFSLLLGKVCSFYRCCLFVNMSVFLKSPTHYVLHMRLMHARLSPESWQRRQHCQLQSTKLNRSLSCVALSGHLATRSHGILHIIKITWLLKCVLLLQCAHLKRGVI